MKAILMVLVLGVVVCVVTSYFLYIMFESWGLSGWIGVALSVVFILFVGGGISRAMLMRRS